ncbi:MAG: IS110 family transposase [Chloroflexi bacterium]|nr:IS110 family transposase [Chloroflexota bacterium]
MADLLRHRLLRGSFIPPAEIRELRELTRPDRVWSKSAAGRSIGCALEDYFDRLHAEHLRHHVQRLEQLDYTVTPAPKQAAS